MKTMKTLLVCLSLLTATAAMAAQKTDEFKTQSGKTVKITNIKHASIMIEYDGKYFYIDPEGTLPPQVNFADYPKANYILVTHEHHDHFDREAINMLRTPATNIYLNRSCYGWFHQGLAMQNGDSLSVDKDIQIVAVPAYNTTEGREKFHPKGRDNGYILILDGLRIYVAGDTEDIPEMEKLWNIDVAFLPCNQPYTMTPEQLVKAAKAFKPKVLYPYHYSETPINRVRLMMNGTGIECRIRDYK